MLVVLSDSLLFALDSRPTTTPAIDLGAQSGHQTQFQFSEGDVRDSDANLVNRPALGKLVIPSIH